MDQESNPIKKHLFEYIKKSETIPQLIIEKKFDQIIKEVTKECYDKIITMAKKEEAVGVLSTGLLHYLLTNALITSQRRVQYENNEIDIVIPDIRTLKMDPKRALIICIPKSSDAKEIYKKIACLEKIQPEKENIWVVLSEYVHTKNRSFVLNKEDNTFAKIIFEIAKFSNVGGNASKFKILRL